MGQDIHLLFSLKQLTNVESSLGFLYQGSMWPSRTSLGCLLVDHIRIIPFLLGPEDSSGIQQRRMVKGYKTTQ